MTKSISNKILFWHTIINLFLSLALTFLMWYPVRSFGIILNYIGYVLFIPSFYIISLFKGVNAAMHFTRDRTYLLVSFIFYSLVIALIQVIILKKKRRKQTKA